MTAKRGHQSNFRYAVVETPHWDVVGKWLIAAGKVDRLWHKALDDRKFNWNGLPVESIYEVDLARHALMHAMKIKEGRASFTVKIKNNNVASGHQFALFVDMGFFTRFNRQYRMTIPVDLSINNVKVAARQLLLEIESGSGPDGCTP